MGSYKSFKSCGKLGIVAAVVVDSATVPVVDDLTTVAKVDHSAVAAVDDSETVQILEDVGCVWMSSDNTENTVA